MGVKIVQNSNTLTAIIDGDIDHHTAKDIRTQIDENIETSEPAILELDFSGVQFMDSSGIGLIIGRFKQMKALGGKLKVVNTPKHIDKLIKLAGLEAFGIISR